MKRWASITAAVMLSGALLLNVSGAQAKDDVSAWPAGTDVDFPPMEWPELTPGRDNLMPGLARGPELVPGFSLNYGTSTQAIGRSEALRAGQRFQIPQLNLVAALMLRNEVIDACSEVMPGVSGAMFLRTYQMVATVDSPEGAEHDWGIFPQFTVRSVAFGAVPAEATIELRQVRRDSGVPEPMQLTTREFQASPASASDPCSAPGEALYDQQRMTGQVEIRVVGLTVDGVEVAVGENCRTANSAQIELSAPDFNFRRDGDFDASMPFPPTTQFFNALFGGLLRGTISIPPFSGCGSTEVFDPLLTALISGEDNPVETRVQRVRSIRAVSPTAPPVYGADEDYDLPDAMDLEPPFVAP